MEARAKLCVSTKVYRKFDIFFIRANDSAFSFIPENDVENAIKQIKEKWSKKMYTAGLPLKAPHAGNRIYSLEHRTWNVRTVFQFGADSNLVKVEEK